LRLKAPLHTRIQHGHSTLCDLQADHPQCDVHSPNVGVAREKMVTLAEIGKANLIFEVPNLQTYLLFVLHVGQYLMS
jgi:hypothetical protein